MNEVIVLAKNAYGGVLNLLEQIKDQEQCRSYVLCTNERNESIYRKSRFVDCTYVLQFINEDDFLEAFKSWFQKLEFRSKPLLYFTNDTYCFLVNQNRDWFEEHCILCLPSSDIVSSYSSKGEAENAAAEQGLLVPKTVNVESVVDLEVISRTFRFPVIIKPLSSYGSQQLPIKTQVLDGDVFLTVTKNYLGSNYRFICQEYIPGGDDQIYFCLFYRSRSGALNSVVGRKIVQNPPGSGIMAKGIIDFDSELNLLCEQFLNRIDYVGLGGLEFKKVEGEYYFIEMNIRIEAIFKVSAMAKVPIGLISYRDLTSKDGYDTSLSQEDGGIYIDLLPILSSYKAMGSYNALFKDFVGLIFSNNTRLNLYNKKDSRPFLSYIKNFIYDRH